MKKNNKEQSIKSTKSVQKDTSTKKSITKAVEVVQEEEKLTRLTAEQFEGTFVDDDSVNEVVCISNALCIEEDFSGAYWNPNNLSPLVSKCTFVGCDFIQAKFENITFRNCVFVSCDFDSAIIRECCIEESSFCGNEFTGAIIDSNLIEDCFLSGKNDFSRVSLLGTNCCGFSIVPNRKTNWDKVTDGRWDCWFDYDSGIKYRYRVWDEVF